MALIPWLRRTRHIEPLRVAQRSGSWFLCLRQFGTPLDRVSIPRRQWQRVIEKNGGRRGQTPYAGQIAAVPGRGHHSAFEWNDASLSTGPLLAPYASRWQGGRGRRIAENRSSLRTSFQRDRDRIIHSAAFRRLALKTQVFVPDEGDHFRTRLTHTIEVAQIARTLARALRLDEDLSEALALAHDLGHPPFGHTGEEALDEVLTPFGGFDHNAQTLRILVMLERRYPGFPGLNLTWDTLDGLAKRGAVACGTAGRARWFRQDLALLRDR